MSDLESDHGDESGHEVDAIEERAKQIRKMIVNDSTRKSYTNLLVNLILWMAEAKPEPLNTDFLKRLKDLPPRQKRVFIKQRLFDANPDDAAPVFDLHVVDRKFVEHWVLSMKKRDGSHPGNSVYNAARSALKHLFRCYGVKMRSDVEDDIDKFFQALRKEVAQVQGNGNLRLQTGKSPMEFSLYRFLATQLLKAGTRDFLFAHAYMTISWNLMCRAGNTTSIRHPHIEWFEDALGVYFAHMKNDQSGDRPKDPRHIYANPLMPEICPVLALGVYLMCTPFSAESNALFPGSKQYDRYQKILKRLLAKDEVATELERRGLEPSELGSHSTRKGAASYCSSGTTSCPSSVAVSLRAGWSLQGVQDRYYRYEAAGDQYVGRTVSGLPYDSPSFAMLPPFFTSLEPVTPAVRACFPGAPPNLHRVLEFCVASVVYHAAFLRQLLPSDHVLFDTPLFTTGLVSTLSPIVCCRLPQDGDGIRATGVPPMVAILRNQAATLAAVNALAPALEAVPSRVVVGVTEVLEQRAINAGTVTYHGLEAMVAKCVGSSFEGSGIPQLIEMIQRLRHVSGSGPLQLEVQPPPPPQQRTYMVEARNGSLHAFPATVSLPRGPALVAFQHYCCYNEEHDYSPLRFLTEKDLPRSQKQRLSEYKLLMQRLEARLRRDGKWVEKEKLSVQEANEMFEYAKEEISAGSETKTGRKRGRALMWTSLVTTLRRKAAAAAAAAADDEDDEDDGGD